MNAIGREVGEVRERPILFSAPMVRAILEGRKTQTRRVVKPVGKDGGFVLVKRDEGDERSWWPHRSDDGELCWHTVKRGGHEYQDDTPHSCPYGAPGDLLWVRETWAQPTDQVTIYRADWREDAQRRGLQNIPADDSDITWRPSIHMPRALSRITLKITDVRVERLQEISYEDACAEGCAIPDCRREPIPEGETWDECARRLRWPQRDYEALWGRINGPDSWAANPWVWVVSFERVTP